MSSNPGLGPYVRSDLMGWVWPWTNPECQPNLVAGGVVAELIGVAELQKLMLVLLPFSFAKFSDLWQSLCLAHPNFSQLVLGEK